MTARKWPWDGSTHGALVKVEIVGRPDVAPVLLAARSIGFMEDHGVVLLSVLGDLPRTTDGRTVDTTGAENTFDG